MVEVIAYVVVALFIAANLALVAAWAYVAWFGAREAAAAGVGRPRSGGRLSGPRDLELELSTSGDGV